MVIPTSKVAILFNGPPRAGKDTAVSAVLNTNIGNIEVFKFTAPVKDLTHKNAGLNCDHDEFEVLKDTPQEVFNGRTPRQAYIDTSEELKEKYGHDAVAKLFVESIMASDADIILNPDCGNDMEALCVADALGHENVFILRVHKDGHDFSQDCREWVVTPLLNIIDIENREGSRREFESEVAARVRQYLSQREPSFDLS